MSTLACLSVAFSSPYPNITFTHITHNALLQPKSNSQPQIKVCTLKTKKSYENQAESSLAQKCPFSRTHTYTDFEKLILRVCSIESADCSDCVGLRQDWQKRRHWESGAGCHQHWD